MDNKDWIKKATKLGMIGGAILALHHYLNYNRWQDENKDDCHGKLGITVFSISGIIRLLADAPDNSHERDAYGRY